MRGTWSYYSIVEDITRSIVTDLYKPGDQLPTMKRMRSGYNVAHSTLQMALAVVRDRGLILGRQGQGIYVAPKEVWKRDRT